MSTVDEPAPTPDDDLRWCRTGHYAIRCGTVGAAAVVAPPGLAVALAPGAQGGGGVAVFDADGFVLTLGGHRLRPGSAMRGAPEHRVMPPGHSEQPFCWHLPSARRAWR